jgi:hypothetical protein
MKGFKLKFNEEIIKAAIDKGVLSLIFTSVSNDDDDSFLIQLRGRDEKNSKELIWLSKEIKVNEEFKVKVITTDRPTEPTSKKSLDDDVLMIEDKLRMFKALKKELEEEGLI